MGLFVSDAGVVDPIPELPWEEASNYLASRLTIFRYLREEENRRRRAEEKARIDWLIERMRHRTQEISPVVEEPVRGRQSSKSRTYRFVIVRGPVQVRMKRYHR